MQHLVVLPKRGLQIMKREVGWFEMTPERQGV